MIVLTEGVRSTMPAAAVREILVPFVVHSREWQGEAER